MAKQAESKLHLLISDGYFPLSCSGVYCNAVKKIGDVDRYVLLEWKNNSWVVLSQ